MKWHSGDLLKLFARHYLIKVLFPELFCIKLLQLKHKTTIYKNGKFLFIIYLFIFKIDFNWRLIILQYSIGFAIHQHESATGIHV